MSQSNDSADCVCEQNRIKFIDDLTILEVFNLLTVGLSSYNVKQQVPSDVLENNQFIDPVNLKSQGYLDEISEWTKNQKMMINKKKSKSMIFQVYQEFSVFLKIGH